MTSSASLNWVQNFSKGICLPINESLRVSDIKRGEGRGGYSHAQERGMFN